MMQIIRNGGLGNGGTNFDAKTRRNSTDLEDIFIAHIAGMDAMARALLSAAEILEKSPYKRCSPTDTHRLMTARERIRRRQADA